MYRGRLEVAVTKYVDYLHAGKRIIPKMTQEQRNLQYRQSFDAAVSRSM